MNTKTISTSREFRLRRSVWAATIASLAMGFALACSGGYGPDDASDGNEDADVIEDHEAVQDDTETVEEKALRPRGLVDALRCEDCITTYDCDYELVSCDPPVFVNGREIKCMQEVCTPKRTCIPCAGAGDLDGIDGIDLEGLGPELGGLGGITPIDPVPFSF